MKPATAGADPFLIPPTGGARYGVASASHAHVVTPRALLRNGKMPSMEVCDDAF